MRHASITTATYVESNWEQDQSEGTTCLSRCSQAKLFEELLKALKYLLFHPPVQQKIPEKQVLSCSQIFKAQLKIFHKRPRHHKLILPVFSVPHKTHTGASEMGSSRSSGTVLLTPAHLRLSLKLQSYLSTALNHILML